MRFRAKFGAIGWCWIGSTCLIAILWLTGLRHSSTGILALFFLLMSIQRVVFHIFIYWDMDSGSLRERRLWNTREIPWPEVTHIANWIPNQPSSDYLEINFDRSPPMSERGSVIANPEDRGGFIAAVRKFAPMAEFEV